MKLRIAYALLLIFCAHKFFFVGDWWYQSGVFNVADVGNALIWGGICLLFILRGDRGVLWNPISALIVVYLLFVCIQISLAALYHGQSLFDGVVGVRHQFYYLSFFLFLFFFDDAKKIAGLLDLLVIVSVALVTLGVLNYFGGTIFSHKYAEGHGIRSGITRAFIPGMSVVSLCTLWLFVKWTDQGNVSNALKASAIYLLAAHFFTQGRMRLIGTVGIILGMLMIKRRWTALFVLLFVGGAAFGVLESVMEENIVATPFSSAYENVVDQTGSWRPRLKQLEVDIQEFVEHPFIGSGVSAIRSPTQQGGTRFQVEMAALSYKDDLGYSHWLKSYGIVGMAWLFLFFYFQTVYAIRIQTRCEGNDKMIALFGLSYFGFVVGSFVTLNHLMLPAGIILVSLNAAIIVRMDWNSQVRTFEG